MVSPKCCVCKGGDKCIHIRIHKDHFEKQEQQSRENILNNEPPIINDNEVIDENNDNEVVDENNDNEVVDENNDKIPLSKIQP